MKSRLTGLILIAVFLLPSSCGRDTVSPSAASLSPIVSPSDGTNSPGPFVSPVEISAVTIKTALEWNSFARAYNTTEAYGSPMTVEIGGQLDFEGLDFVPLYKPFNGVIRGTVEIEGYTEDAMESEKLYPSSHYWRGGYGFFNITGVEETTGLPIAFYSSQEGMLMTYEAREAGKADIADYINDTRIDPPEATEPGGLFGVRCGTLNLENLVFSGISADLRLISFSVDILTMRNIVITDFRASGEVLANNAGRVTVENLLVAQADTRLITSGGGLLDWVYEDAVFRKIGAAHLNVLLIPDGGGSGYFMGDTALFVSRAGGGVSFEQIEIYHCSVYSLNSVVLCQAFGSLPLCSDITVQSSSFLGFPLTDKNSMTGAPVNKLLFGRDVRLSGLSNILLQDSMFNSMGDFEDYPEYTVKNCVSITHE